MSTGKGSGLSKLELYKRIGGSPKQPLRGSLIHTGRGSGPRRDSLYTVHSTTLQTESRSGTSPFDRTRATASRPCFQSMNDGTLEGPIYKKQPKVPGAHRDHIEQRFTWKKNKKRSLFTSDKNFSAFPPLPRGTWNEHPGLYPETLKQGEEYEVN